jgi:predicted nuclease of predicted toxin-antitoxin system
MKCIVDAQLPVKLATFLTSHGIDALHTDEMPHRERTTDDEIRTIALTEQRMVLTKDADFLDSYILRGIPPKIFLISTGNISNKALLTLFEKYIARLPALFAEHSFLELNNHELIIHE